MSTELILGIFALSLAELIIRLCIYYEKLQLRSISRENEDNIFESLFLRQPLRKKDIRKKLSFWFFNFTDQKWAKKKLFSNYYPASATVLHI